MVSGPPQLTQQLISGTAGGPAAAVTANRSEMSQTEFYFPQWLTLHIFNIEASLLFFLFISEAFAGEVTDVTMLVTSI